MNYFEFRNFVQAWPVISLNMVLSNVNNPGVQKNQISFWCKRGLLKRLKKGLYILNENDRKITPSREFIANQLVFPSYISMESALSFYQLIPERVYQVTSITPKKTISFTNQLGTFVFRNLQTGLFFGYTNQKDENHLPFFLADKEKALLDFVYLNMKNWSEKDRYILVESYRMENLDTFDFKKLDTYLRRFNSKKLSRLIQNMLADELNV